MSSQLVQLPLPLPEALRQWITFNAEFYVFLCYTTGCQHALAPGSISRHLRDKHQVKTEVQKQADQYIEQWQWQYDFQSVPLPLDRSLPQPVLPVFNGFQCNDCNFKTQSRKVIRKHGNKEHNKKRVKDKEIFHAVQLQTWFTEKKARYWVVDATRQSRDVNNSSGSGSGSQDESSTEAIHQALQLEVQQNEQLKRFHQLLHAHCIYCQLMRVEGEEYSHCHGDCPHAGSRNCDVQAYRRWRSQLRLAPRH